MARSIRGGTHGSNIMGIR